MIQLSLSQAEKILNGEQRGLDTTFTGVSIDTRSLQPLNLFVAIAGEKMDGHDFLAEAKSRGAVAAMVEHFVDIDLPQLLVPNTTLALGQLAAYWRNQFEIPVVGITGSCGKTTTKQMTGAILNQAGQTLISEGNQNNHWGVPLTLLKLNKTHRYAVIEMGADRPGDIQYLSQLVKPQIALITNVVTVHIDENSEERFKNIEAIFTEKSHLFSSLPDEGVMIVNADSPFYSAWMNEYIRGKHLSFGLDTKADLHATDCLPNEHMQYAFQLHTPVGTVPVQLSALGKHNIENALAASAVAVSLGISLTQIQAGLAQVAPVARRLQQYRSAEGALLIDDSYNANVKSVTAVIELLSQYPHQRILVLGDMNEIGKTSTEEHKKAGLLAKQLKVDRLYALGEKTQHAVKAFGEGAQHFHDHSTLISALKKQLNSKTVVLIKGSFSMHMDKVIHALKT